MTTATRTRFTNRYNVHPAIVSAIVNDPYERRGDISVTGLLRPPQMAQLEREHEDEIEIDVSSRLFALLGQSVHEVLARADHPNGLPEEALSLKMHGWEITGRPDLWADNTITDFKVTSVWSFLLGDKPEWEAQLNFYALLYREAGFAVENLEIAAILRDWQKRRSMEDADYPPAPFMRVKIPLWDEAKAREIMGTYITMHKYARNGLPMPCNDEERWAKPDKWAVMKKGQKRALRLFDSEADAVARLGPVNDHPDAEHGLSVQHRPGDKTVRCRDYCDVAQFCSQFKELQEVSNG